MNVDTNLLLKFKKTDMIGSVYLLSEKGDTYELGIFSIDTDVKDDAMDVKIITDSLQQHLLRCIELARTTCI